MNLLPQFGFFELILIAVVALVVVGPKDLPKLMRSAGRMLGQARRMAGEFTAAFDQMAREAEMDDLRKEIEELKQGNPVADAKRALEETTAPIARDLREQSSALNDAVNQSLGDANETASEQQDPAETVTPAKDGAAGA